MNFEEEKNENNSSRQPIMVVALLIIIAGACFYYFNQQITNSITNALAPNTEPFSLAPDPDIKFNFLNSKEFNDLVEFPDYASFKEDDELTIKPGRLNPFSADGTGVPVQVNQPAASETPSDSSTSPITTQSDKQNQ